VRVCGDGVERHEQGITICSTGENVGHFNQDGKAGARWSMGPGCTQATGKWFLGEPKSLSHQAKL
jgi:hypothetical protein